MFHGTGVVNQDYFCQQGIGRPDDDDEDDQGNDDDGHDGEDDKDDGDNGDDYEDVASSSRITFARQAS